MADSLHDYHRAVLEAMHRAGCAPSDPGVIVFDGRLHRFHVQDDKRGSRNGWFVLDDDGVPGGSFGSWRTGQPQTWRAEVREELTPEQRRRRERRIAEARARRREAQRALHERARARAGELWARARPLVDARHPYLVNKHVPAIGLRQLGELLVVPARDGDGGLHSLEFINPEGVKRFLKDGVVEGHFHGLGDPRGARALLLCEGYATGASLHRASGLPVMVCFNRANLLPVARDLRRRYPEARLVMAADDDRHTPGNPGRRDAQEAARWVGGAVILPDFTGLDRRSEPTDFNDLQVLGGVPRLQAALQTQLAAVLPGGAAPPPDNDPRPAVPGRQVGRLHHEDTAAREGEREPLPVAAMAAPARGAARGGGRCRTAGANRAALPGRDLPGADAVAASGANPGRRPGALLPKAYHRAGRLLPALLPAARRARRPRDPHGREADPPAVRDASLDARRRHPPAAAGQQRLSDARNQRRHRGGGDPLQAPHRPGGGFRRGRDSERGAGQARLAV